MKVRVEVDGVPPKKDGANSMWRKASEFERLRALRVAVASALARVGSVPDEGAIRLSLRVYAPREAGDLDSFVTGAFDGLMAAHTGVPIDLALWAAVPEAARPDRALLYVDDSRVSKIEAERLAPDDSTSRYEVEVEFS